jgi:hypothetical protein
MSTIRRHHIKSVTIESQDAAMGFAVKWIVQGASESLFNVSAAASRILGQLNP